jgi:hypothetical protein
MLLNLLPRRWFKKISKYNDGVIKILYIDPEKYEEIIELLDEYTYDLIDENSVLISNENITLQNTIWFNQNYLQSLYNVLVLNIDLMYDLIYDFGIKFVIYKMIGDNIDFKRFLNKYAPCYFSKQSIKKQLFNELKRYHLQLPVVKLVNFPKNCGLYDETFNVWTQDSYHDDDPYHDNYILYEIEHLSLKILGTKINEISKYVNDQVF